MSAEIDLSQFCSKDDSREFLQTPWSAGEYSIATDGKLLIVVARHDNIPERSDAPKIDHISDGKWEYFQELPKLPEVIMEDCKHCDGTGFHECGCGDRHDCGYCVGTVNVASNEIQLVKIDHATLDAFYLRKIAALPNLKFGVGDTCCDPAKLTFDGGFGFLTGMRTT